MCFVVVSLIMSKTCFAVVSVRNVETNHFETVSGADFQQSFVVCLSMVSGSDLHESWF